MDQDGAAYIYVSLDINIYTLIYYTTSIKVMGIETRKTIMHFYKLHAAHDP